MIEQMAAHDMLRDMPVIIVSTEGSKTRIDDLFAKGVKAYLRKPITPEQLRTVIHDVMGE